MANALDIELHAQGAETGAGSGVAVDIGETRSAVLLRLRFIDNTGCLVTIETSPDGVSGWRKVDVFSVVVGASSQARGFDRCDRYVRCSWNAAATFSLVGEAHTLFAEREDICNGEIPEKTFECISAKVWADCLLKASQATEDAFRTANPAPLTKWSPSVAQNTASVAAYLLMGHRGFDPEGPDALIVDKHNNAQKWLVRVANGEIRPVGVTPGSNLGVHQSSGNPTAPDCYPPRFSDNFGDF